MASDMASRRLRKELMAIKRTPIDNIVVSEGRQVWRKTVLWTVICFVLFVKDKVVRASFIHHWYCKL